MVDTRNIAIFLATSGHSGVDRIMTNFIHEVIRRELPVDLLRISNHGPYLDPVPAGLNIVELGTSHVNSSLPALISYLRKQRPFVLLTDKDRVNRIAILARMIAGSDTRLVVRTGTTVSVDMKHRSWFQQWLQIFSYRYLYPKADAIIVPSAGAAEDLARIGNLQRNRVRVLVSPVLTDSIITQASSPVDHAWLASSETIPVILGVGELSPRKDFGTLLKAFAKVRQGRLCRLIILGKGKQTDDLQNLAMQLGIENDMSLPGFVDNPYSYMSKASMLVLTSRWEGSPVVLMEALALGLPVVATDCPSGPREILENGRLGALVPVGDVEALAEKISDTLNAPPDAAFLRSAAQKYHVTKSADQYLNAMGIES